LSRLRATLIITISCLLIALSSAAQDSPGAPGPSSEQDAVSKAHALLVQAAGIVDQASQPGDEHTWSDLAFAAARAKDVPLAIRASSKSPKDTESIARVAVVLMRDGNKKEAYEVLRALEGSQPPITPELGAFEILIESQLARGDMAGAKESFELMKKAAGPEPDSTDVKDAQKKIQAKEDGDPKWDFATALNNVKKIPDPLLRGQVLALLAVKEMEAGDRAGSAEALRLGELDLNQSKAGMDKSGDHWGLIVLAQAEARLGNVNKALEIAEHLPHNDSGAYLEARDSRTMALLHIVYEQARGGDVAGAFETAQRFQNDESRFEILEKVVTLQLSKHDNAAALQTCQRIFDLPVKPAFRKSRGYLETLLRTAERQNEAGAGQLSETNIARVIKEGKLLKDADDRNRLFGEIAEVQAESGDFEGATGQLEQMTSERMGAITLIAKAQAERKRFSDALKTMAMAPAKCSEPDPPIFLCGLGNLPFQDVFRQFARLGDQDDALNWANSRTSPSDKATALVAVAQGLLDRGYPDETEPDETETGKETDADSLRYWEEFTVGGIFGASR